MLYEEGRAERRKVTSDESDVTKGALDFRRKMGRRGWYEEEERCLSKWRCVCDELEIGYVPFEKPEVASSRSTGGDYVG